MKKIINFAEQHNLWFVIESGKSLTLSTGRWWKVILRKNLSNKFCGDGSTLNKAFEAAKNKFIQND
jgi:hypothetical protein